MSTDRPLRDSDERDEGAFVQEFGASLDALKGAMRECPPFDQVLAAERGVLPDPLQGRVAAHLDGCVLCQALLRDVETAELGAGTPDALDRIASRMRKNPPARAVAARPSRWHRASLAVAASIAVVIAAGSAGRLYRQNLILVRQVQDASAAADAATRRLQAEQSRADTAEAGLARLRDESAGPQLNAPVVDLEPVNSLRAAGAARVFEIAGKPPLVTLVLAAGSGGLDAEYGLEIRDATGRVAWEGTGLRKSPALTFTLIVPTRVLPAGDVTLNLFRTSAGARADVLRYAVRIVYK